MKMVVTVVPISPLTRRRTGRSFRDVVDITTSVWKNLTDSIGTTGFQWGDVYQFEVIYEALHTDRKVIDIRLERNPNV